MHMWVEDIRYSTKTRNDQDCGAAAEVCLEAEGVLRCCMLLVSRHTLAFSIKLTSIGKTGLACRLRRELLGGLYTKSDRRGGARLLRH
jgi:hypothetical protein